MQIDEKKVSELIEAAVLEMNETVKTNAKLLDDKEKGLEMANKDSE
ncbi:MAG: hypothetical protein MJ246_08770 [Clostridia bacterium]|nr:hypothetical protein [Clostridia bacterium]